MILKTDFETFLKGIRPTSAMRDNLKKGHKTLRDRLNADADLKPILVSDFLQGSYRLYTAVRPKGDKRSDVDIIVVTKLDETEYTPKNALALFEPFLNKHYNGKWHPQGRSFGIELSYVELDVVPTSAPTEQEYGILRSDSVTHDGDLFEARELQEWRLHPTWPSPASRFQLGRVQASYSSTRRRRRTNGRHSLSGSRTAMQTSGATRIPSNRSAGRATRTRSATVTS